MISTHNHVDMAAPWSAQGQFTATLLPPIRAGNSVTARRSLSGPGSTAALRVGSRGAPHPATCPPIWARRAPCRQPHASTPVGPSPSGHAQANCCTQLHTGGEPGQASTDPTRPQRARPSGVARPKGVCPGWAGNDASMVMLRRIGRRRAAGAGAGPMVRAFGEPEPAPRTAAPPSSPGPIRPALRDPPRVGPAEGNSAATPPPLSCRGPMVSSTCFTVVSHALRPATYTTRRDAAPDARDCANGGAAQRRQGRVPADPHFGGSGVAVPSGASR
jgi:hypothetical protein